MIYHINYENKNVSIFAVIHGARLLPEQRFGP